jgi:hypothetical protein
MNIDMFGSCIKVSRGHGKYNIFNNINIIHSCVHFYNILKLIFIAKLICMQLHTILCAR